MLCGQILATTQPTPDEMCSTPYVKGGVGTKLIIGSRRMTGQPHDSVGTLELKDVGTQPDQWQNDFFGRGVANAVQ